MSLVLQVFGPAFGLPDPSPFAMKGDMLMKMSGIDYRAEPGDVTKTPKKKLPVLLDHGEVITDSTFIRLHLEQKYGIDFDAGLDARQRAIACRHSASCAGESSITTRCPIAAPVLPPPGTPPSTTVTRRPRSANPSAVQAPTIPAPMTRASRCVM